MKVLFIGHFSNVNNVQNGASIAGDAVQRKIVDALRHFEKVNSLAVSQAPAQAWPKGKLLLTGSRDEYAIYPWFINIPFLRDMAFGVWCFFYIMRYRPSHVVQYNSYLLVNFFVLLAAFVFEFKKIMIIQDYRVGGDFKFLLRLHDKLAGKLVRWFDLVAPVTAALAKELKVNANKVYVLPGAMEHTAPLVRRRSCRRDMVKVLYAGALERHNGVDKLIKAWKDVPPRFHLFIYGKGSLEKEVTQACKEANNISYMGLASKNKIHTEMLSSDFNVCFRFSSGIDERFFFPSKFFSINCYPGFSLINNFHGVPEKYRELGGLVDNDLNNLACILNKADTYLDNKTAERQGFLYSRYQWSIVLREIL